MIRVSDAIAFSASAFLLMALVATRVGSLSEAFTMTLIGGWQVVGVPVADRVEEDLEEDNA